MADLTAVEAGAVGKLVLVDAIAPVRQGLDPRSLAFRGRTGDEDETVAGSRRRDVEEPLSLGAVVKDLERLVAHPGSVEGLFRDS